MSSGGGRGGTFLVAIDNVPLTEAQTVPDTGGWDVWRTIIIPVSLPAGRHVLSLSMLTNGETGLTGNFNWIAVR